MKFGAELPQKFIVW